jgi:hypothetical protein
VIETKFSETFYADRSAKKAFPLSGRYFLRVTIVTTGNNPENYGAE